MALLGDVSQKCNVTGIFRYLSILRKALLPHWAHIIPISSSIANWKKTESRLRHRKVVISKDASDPFDIEKMLSCYHAVCWSIAFRNCSCYL